jgi:hypothetical protein
MKFGSGQALGLLIGLSLASGVAHATSIEGSFSITGTTYISATVFDFGLISQPPPGDQTASIAAQGTNTFSYLTATEQIGIHNVNLGEATVTPTDIGFDNTVPSWIVLPAGIDLSLTDIPLNPGIPVCSTLGNEDAPGAICIPYTGSSLVLEQEMSTVRAVFDFVGNAYYTGSPADLSPYTGEFISQFAGDDGTISGLLSSFNSAGSLTTSYSATFTAAAVPESGTFPMLAVGLLSIAFLGRKKIAKPTT